MIDFLHRFRVRLVDIEQRVLSLLYDRPFARTAEYGFVFKNLPKVGSLVLDIGCHDSLLALKLAQKGYVVYGIDVRRYTERHANLTFFQCDATSMLFKDQLFDVVIAVSTIEHIGLGAYGDPIHDNADTRTVAEIHRVLKPGGSFIVTVPFAAEHKLAMWGRTQERYYDTGTLAKLFEGFHLSVQEFFIGKSLFNWVNASEEEARNPNLKWHANTALVLVKE